MTTRTRCTRSACGSRPGSEGPAAGQWHSHEGRDRCGHCAGCRDLDARLVSRVPPVMREDGSADADLVSRRAHGLQGFLIEVVFVDPFDLVTDPRPYADIAVACRLARPKAAAVIGSGTLAAMAAMPKPWWRPSGQACIRPMNDRFRKALNFALESTILEPSRREIMSHGRQID